MILSIQRGKKVMPMHVGLSLAGGDVAAVAIHRDDRESAQEIETGRESKSAVDDGSSLFDIFKGVVLSLPMTSPSSPSSVVSCG